MLNYGMHYTSLGETIRATALACADFGTPLSPENALYCEKPGGFQCGTCLYVTRANATHGKCRVVAGTVHLTEGCCAMWDADPEQLHLYRIPSAER